MKKLNLKYRKLNFLFITITISILFVGFVSIYKTFFVEPTYIYVKVKVGQGLWWASTQRPNAWFVKAIKKAKEETDFMGRPIARILKVNYYPWYGSSQYDVFVTVKLKVLVTGKNKTYTFKRGIIGVGSPIDLEFANVQFSGTIVQMTESPPKELYVKKTVYLIKKYAYPWEFDAIRVGDVYYNGEKNVFKVLEKSFSEENKIMTAEEGKYYNPDLIEKRNYIIVKTHMLGVEDNGKFIFQEEQIIAPGRSISTSTENFTFEGYMIAKVD